MAWLCWQSMLMLSFNVHKKSCIIYHAERAVGTPHPAALFVVAEMEKLLWWVGGKVFASFHIPPSERASRPSPCLMVCAMSAGRQPTNHPFAGRPPTIRDVPMAWGQRGVLPCLCLSDTVSAVRGWPPVPSAPLNDAYQGGDTTRYSSTTERPV